MFLVVTITSAQKKKTRKKNELLGTVREAPTSRPEPRGLQEGFGAQEGGDQFLKSM